MHALSSTSSQAQHAEHLVVSESSSTAKHVQQPSPSGTLPQGILHIDLVTAALAVNDCQERRASVACHGATCRCSYRSSCRSGFLDYASS